MRRRVDAVEEYPMAGGDPLARLQGESIRAHRCRHEQQHARERVAPCGSVVGSGRLRELALYQHQFGEKKQREQEEGVPDGRSGCAGHYSGTDFGRDTPSVIGRERIGLSTAEQKGAKWRREIGPLGGVWTVTEIGILIHFLRTFPLF